MTFGTAEVIYTKKEKKNFYKQKISKKNKTNIFTIFNFLPATLAHTNIILYPQRNIF
jgi:hypothetical protein